jgi:hypothetical protein
VLFGFGLFCFWGLFFVFFWFVGVFWVGLVLNCRMSVPMLSNTIKGSKGGKKASS